MGHEAGTVRNERGALRWHRPDREEPVALDRRVEHEPIDRPPHASGESAVAPAISEGLVIELVDDDLALVREAARDHEPCRAHRVVARRHTDGVEDVRVVLDHEPIEAAHAAGEGRWAPPIAEVEPLVGGGRRGREHLDLVPVAPQRLHLLHRVRGDAVAVGGVGRDHQDATHGRVHSSRVLSIPSSTSVGA